MALEGRKNSSIQEKIARFIFRSLKEKYKKKNLNNDNNLSPTKSPQIIPIHSFEEQKYGGLSNSNSNHIIEMMGNNLKANSNDYYLNKRNDIQIQHSPQSLQFSPSKVHVIKAEEVEVYLNLEHSFRDA